MRRPAEQEMNIFAYLFMLLVGVGGGLICAIDKRKWKVIGSDNGLFVNLYMY